MGISKKGVSNMKGTFHISLGGEHKIFTLWYHHIINNDFMYRDIWQYVQNLAIDPDEAYDKAKKIAGDCTVVWDVDEDRGILNKMGIRSSNKTFDGTTLTTTALTVDDVAVDGKVVTMTGSASDTAVLTAGTNGTLSIVTTDAAAAAANIQITADGTVDIDSAGVLTLDSGAAINIEPASGSAILLDGTISIDAGVVTGATSITSTAFVGNVTGNASGTAATVTTAAQSNITSLGTLTTLTVDNVITNGTTIGHTDDTDLLTLADGVLTVAGEVSATTLDIGGTNIGSTAAELNLLDGSAKSTSSITLADSDAIIVIDGTTTKQIPASDLKTYNPGGTSWQAVKTGNFTAAAGQGVFCNTTSSAFTITLPAGSIGDEVSIIDYAGTFDSNNLTVAANGSEKIHGSTDDLTVATERAAFTLVFTDSTQGWLLKDK